MNQFLNKNTQEGFLKCLGDIAKVLLDLDCLSFFFLFLILHVIPDELDDAEIRSL